MSVPAQSTRFDSIRTKPFLTQVAGLNFKTPDYPICLCCKTDTTKMPLYIIDDKIIYHNKAIIEKLDPSWVDSIDVVKDAEAIRKYGDSANYGVIIIKTKKQRP